MYNISLESAENGSFIIENPCEILSHDCQIYNIRDYGKLKMDDSQEHELFKQNEYCQTNGYAINKNNKHAPNTIEERIAFLTTDNDRIFPKESIDTFQRENEDYENMLSLEEDLLNLEQTSRYPHAIISYENIKEKKMMQQNLFLDRFYQQKEGENNGQDRIKHLLDTISKTIVPLTKIMSDKELQVCLKPSDMYVFLDANKAPMPHQNSSVKIVRPFKYHKPYLHSSALMCPIYRMVTMNQNVKKERAAMKFPDDIILKDNSSTKSDVNDYINLKCPLNGRNQMLYQNKFVDLENNISSQEESAVDLSNPYLSLRNLYSQTYLQNGQSKISKTHQQCKPKLKKIRERKLFRSFDSQSEIHVSDEEYRRWLKKHNFLKYSNLTISSITSISTAFQSLSDNTIPTTTELANNNQIVKQEQRKKMKNKIINSRGIGFIGFLEYFVLYEHVVLINFIDFILTYPYVRRKEISFYDRLSQVVFFIICYIVIQILNNVGLHKNFSKWK